jgi:hypothetical protein
VRERETETEREIDRERGRERKKVTMPSTCFDQLRVKSHGFVKGN